MLAYIISVCLLSWKWGSCSSALAPGVLCTLDKVTTYSVTVRNSQRRCDVSTMPAAAGVDAEAVPPAPVTGGGPAGAAGAALFMPVQLVAESV